MANSEVVGFTSETIKFLKDLKANNNREWFNKNKARYESAIKVPAQFFCEAMTGELNSLTGIDHKSKIYRIYRDLRFSKDKTPYNAHVHISFIPLTKRPSPPSWFFGLESDHLTIGAGVFAFDKLVLEAFRKQVAGGGGKKIALMLKALENEGIRLSDVDLKRVPSGYPQDHQNGDLLRRKGLSAWIDFKSTDLVGSENAVDEMIANFKRLKPLYDFLMKIKS